MIGASLLHALLSCCTSKRDKVLDYLHAAEKLRTEFLYKDVAFYSTNSDLLTHYVIFFQKDSSFMKFCTNPGPDLFTLGSYTERGDTIICKPEMLYSNSIALHDSSISYFSNESVDSIKADTTDFSSYPRYATLPTYFLKRGQGEILDVTPGNIVRSSRQSMWGPPMPKYKADPPNLLKRIR